MAKVRFEWDEEKDKENQDKHNVSFSLAQIAFLDPHTVLLSKILTIVLRKNDFTVLDVSATA